MFCWTFSFWISRSITIWLFEFTHFALPNALHLLIAYIILFLQAGASLEALAKGAVQFSRRFTFQELQDRWYTLLYDPDISAQASARMGDLQRSASNLSSELNRSDKAKQIPEKRKFASFHKQYYAMR